MHNMISFRTTFIIPVSNSHWSSPANGKPKNIVHGCHVVILKHEKNCLKRVAYLSYRALFWNPTLTQFVSLPS
jgi:hypothetical protein